MTFKIEPIKKIGKDQTISTTVKAAEAERIFDVAQRHGVTVATLVRLCIAYALANMELPK